MVGIIKRTTSNYNLRIPNFDLPGWGRELERNSDILDAAIYAATGLSNISGVWENDTTYVQGDRVVDQTDNTIWRVEVDHTSAESGTFATDRTANPTYWTAVTQAFNAQGQWTTATNYSINDIVYDGYVWALAVNNFESGATLAADIANGDFVVLVDATDTVTDAETAQTAAELAQSLAETAQTAAELAETNAETAQTASETAQGLAEDARDAALVAETNAETAQSAAEDAQALAEAAATDAETAETNAAASAAAAAASYDSFDDRYLGAKAADPTVDNDGNALITGAIYWNSTTAKMRVWDGVAWQDANINQTNVGITGGSIEGLSTFNVIDTVLKINDNDDPTKIMRFECSGISTGTTRAFVMPNFNLIFGAYAPTFLNTSNEAAFKAAVNLEVGVDVQAYDADTTKNDAANEFTAAQTFGVGADSVKIKTTTSGGGTGYIRYNGTSGVQLGYIGYLTTGDGMSIVNSVGALVINSAGNTDIDGATVRSQTIYNGTTASAANVNVDNSGGLLRRSTSSLQYKTDVEDAAYELSEAIVMNSRPIWYRSLCAGDNPEWSHWGFGAEEIAKIDPRLVHWGHPRRLVEVARDIVVGFKGKGENRKPIVERHTEMRLMPDETQPLQPEGVAYERYVVHLTAVAQKQQKLIEELTARLDAAGL